ncbi:MAG: DUF2807 domain-containing protein [Flavobacteriaceae bacterium]|nr:DUF2807 domain-containing protein [Flavobacteriaceae bacterium]
MKKIVFLLVLIFSALQQSVCAQQTIRDVGDFTALRVFDKIPVTLISSSESKVEVSGIKHEDVEIINKNGELKIRMIPLKFLSGDDVTVKVYYEKLDDIQASEGAVIKGSGKIDADLLSLNAKEGAKIEVKVNVRKINAKVNSGGGIIVSGEAEDQDIVITSGGRYDAKNILSDRVTVAVNAGGSAIVHASDQVDAKTRAGGNIDIYGGAKVSQKTFAGGTITVH